MQRQLQHRPLRASLQEQELAAALGVITAQLAAQHEAVESIAEDAQKSHDNVQGGNRELQQAVQRPGMLREVAVTILVSLTLLLVFLDWYSP